jgi:MFS family permease
LFKSRSTLPSTVWVLGLVSLLNDFASDLIYPLIPIYLASVLMAGPGALGVIEGIADMVGSLLKLFSGIVADRVRMTKLLVAGGYGLAAISRPLLVLASSWPIVLGLRFLDRVGKGLRTSPRDAMLAAAVTDGQRGLAFGLQRAMDNAGAVIGPLVATGLLAAHVPIETIFLWTVVPGAAAVGLTLSLKEPARELRCEARAFDWSPAALPPAYKRYLWVLALFTLGNSSNMFLLLRARELGMPDYRIPLLWGLASLVAALFSTYLSGLSDRVGRVRMIVAGWTVYALFYLALGLNAANTAILWPLFAFYGLFMAATEGTEKALVADLAPAALLGTAYGWFNLTTGILLLPASFVFGALWQHFDSEWAFGFAAGCAFVAALLLKYRIGRDLTCHASAP